MKLMPRSLLDASHLCDSFSCLSSPRKMICGTVLPGIEREDRAKLISINPEIILPIIEASPLIHANILILKAYFCNTVLSEISSSLVRLA